MDCLNSTGSDGVKACRGGPGECAHNGACMYACGAAVPCRFCNGSGKASDEMCGGCMGTGEDAAASGVAACRDCNQPMADHINGCPIYPPLGTPGETCPAAAAGVDLPDGGQR